MRHLASLLSVFLLSGCSTIVPIEEAPSLGELNSAISYIPLDPLPVAIRNDKSCAGAPVNAAALLDSLPDNAVRVSIKQVSGKGGLTLGPAAVGSEGGQYQVVLDYVNADTANIRFVIGMYTRNADGSYSDPQPIGSNLPPGAEVLVKRVDDESSIGSNEVVIPVNVGVGLRLTANVTVLKGSVNLASLGAIAASVEANRASGSLVVQTLGINGKQVAASLPLPSELNNTTVQNAIQSLGAIKAVIYDTANTRIVPRVTGIYSPLQTNDPRLINAIVSQLAKSHIPWSPPCVGFGTASAPRAN